jgi:hypothetical protein
MERRHTGGRCHHDNTCGKCDGEGREFFSSGHTCSLCGGSVIDPDHAFSIDFNRPRHYLPFTIFHNFKKRNNSIILYQSPSYEINNKQVGS